MSFVFRPASLLAFMLLVVLWVMPVQKAQAQFTPSSPRYSVLWEPITGSQMRASVRRNAHNAQALQDLWWRAALYDQAGDYMNTLGQVATQEPDNATATAVYAIELYHLGAARLRSSDPNNFQPRLNDSPAAVRFILNKAKAMAPRLWLIPLGESILIPGPSGNLATMWKDRVHLARQALLLQKNPQTYVNLSDALFARGANENNMQLFYQAIRVLEQARKDYPTDPYVLGELYNFYQATKNPKTGEVKAAILATIRPALIGTKPVRRYFEQIRLK